MGDHNAVDLSGIVTGLSNAREQGLDGAGRPRLDEGQPVAASDEIRRDHARGAEEVMVEENDVGIDLGGESIRGGGVRDDSSHLNKVRPAQGVRDGCDDAAGEPSANYIAPGNQFCDTVYQAF